MALYISKSKNTNVCSVAWFCPNQIFIDHKTVEVETFALLPLWIIISLYPCSEHTEHVFSPGTCNTRPWQSGERAPSRTSRTQQDVGTSLVRGCTQNKELWIVILSLY